MGRCLLLGIGALIGCASAGPPGSAPRASTLAPAAVQAAPAAPGAAIVEAAPAAPDPSPPPPSGWRSVEGPPELFMLEISAGSDVTCALYRAVRDAPPEPGVPGEGRVIRCRGRHVDEVVTTPFVPILDDATDLAVGRLDACAVRADGSVWCWDYYRAGVPGRRGPVPRQVSGLSAIVQVAVSSQRCALREDGAVLCWGGNEYGQIGDGTRAERAEPVVVLTGAAQVATGLGHTCARITDGTVQCWGKSTHGELGRGSRTWRALPGPVLGLRDVVEIATTGEHTCARLADGTARCWGANWSGQCGDGTRVARTLPVAVRGLRGVKQLSGGDEHSCAVVEGGRLYCWGSNFYGEMSARGGHQATPRAVMEGVAQVTSGHTHACAMLLDGTGTCWGSDRTLFGPGSARAGGAPLDSRL